MTLGIRPEHIALSSQAEGGVPLVMDTLEILGADNRRTDAGANRSWWCDWRIRSADGRQHAVAASAGKSATSFDGETGQRV